MVSLVLLLYFLFSLVLLSGLKPLIKIPRYPDKSLLPPAGPPKPLPPNDCTCGSPWVEMAFPTVAGDLDVTLLVKAGKLEGMVANY